MNYEITTVHFSNGVSLPYSVYIFLLDKLSNQNQYYNYGIR